MLTAALVSWSGVLFAQSVDAVIVSPDPVILTRGATKQLTATTQDVNGAVLTGRSVEWISSDTAVATVDKLGLVTAVSPGSALVTAMSEAKTGTSVVVVLSLADSPTVPSIDRIIVPLPEPVVAPSDESAPSGSILPGDLAHEAFVNSEAERYLRVLQSTNRATLYPWSIRSFSQGEVRQLLMRDSTHPWQQRFAGTKNRSQRLRFDWVDPEVSSIYNSAFPYGTNDGAVWAGRGLTTVITGGFAAAGGPFSLTVAPLAFWAENRPFTLGATGIPGRAHADWRVPDYIDLPQRFGEGSYMRVDPGQSTLRVDLLGMAVGISTANEHWGPAIVYPLLLGNNAPGFWHGFLGTSRPTNVWIGQVHTRVIWGRLDQSLYSPVPPDSAPRLLSSLVVSFSPRGLNGLEIGGARIFHSRWSGFGVEQIAKPFEGLFKADQQGTDTTVIIRNTDENQLASVFARWVLPESGFEVYGEYMKDDYAYDLRDLVLGPDRNSGYMLGFQRSWNRAPESIISLRGELLNSRVPPTRHGSTAPLYVHGLVRQGHTQRGQILGSGAAYGGSGAILSLDRYDSNGRQTVFWTRTLQDNVFVSTDDGHEPLDVTHSLGAEILLARRLFDLTAGVTGSYNFNRYSLSDAMNMNVRLGLRMNM